MTLAQDSHLVPSSRSGRTARIRTLPDDDTHFFKTAGIIFATPAYVILKLSFRQRPKRGGTLPGSASGSIAYEDPEEELSYNKMLGQLQDVGNTVTLANYLDLLDKAGMIAALPKHHAKELERRRSSPRLMVYDTSLMCAISKKGRDRILSERDLYGCLAIAFVRIRSEAGA